MDSLSQIKSWLGSGSINVFGMPMSGKDTVGKALADRFRAKFISSGDLIRYTERNVLHRSLTKTGNLVPTGFFYQCVLPYFKKPEFEGMPFILSAVGRWDGEETLVMKSLDESKHPLKAVVLLDIPEAIAMERREKALELKDRGIREDDADPEVFTRRLREYRSKTVPVINRYQRMGLLIKVNGDQSREDVLYETLEKLLKKTKEF